MSRADDRRDVESLIQGYLDGSLTENESQRLLAALRRDPAYVGVILDSLRTDCLIRAVVAETATGNEKIQQRAPGIASHATSRSQAPEPGPVTPCAPRTDSKPFFSSDAAHGLTRPAFTTRRWPQVLALAASVALLIGLSVWFFGPTVGEPVLAEARGGDTSIERGTEFIPASYGLRLQPTDVLRTGTNAMATITFGKEKTSLELQPETELKLTSFRKRKRFELRAGKVDAAVARQRPFATLVILTSQAEARVLGTRFTLTTSTNSTRLDVAEGRVRLSRRSNREAVKVGTGQYAVVPAGPELKALPQTGSLLREIWTGIPGGRVRDLLYHPDYPARPATRDLVKSFETGEVRTNDFGCRLVGYIHPPVTGRYTFWIEAAADGMLWISPNENPAEKVRIAMAADLELAMPQSPAITLVAGRRYFIQAVQKTARGSSCLAVAWQPPGGERKVIPGEFLSQLTGKPKEKQR